MLATAVRTAKYASTITSMTAAMQPLLPKPWICSTCLRNISRSRLFSPRFQNTIRLSSSAAAPATSASTSSTNRNENGYINISPTLLARARHTAEEHMQLTSKIAESFEHAGARRLSELRPIADALSDYNAAADALEELNSLLRDPSSDEELRNLAEEDLQAASETLSQASQKLTESLVPKHPFDNFPCLIEIRPGVGGSEAALFAGDLLRMYRSYCSNNGMRVTVLKYETIDGMSDPNGSDAPVAEAILEITDAGAYGKLRCEAGVHRVQRVPATESKGRTHTSVASVLVLPSFPDSEESGGATDELNFEDPSSDYYIAAADVRVEVMRAKGAGGQHVNTTDSAVRLTHIPTGIVVGIQDSRSQPKNKAKAWQVLRARLAQKKREEREEEMLALRRSVPGGAGKTGRNDKIRTYNWGQKRVTDHRSGITLSGALDDVVRGGDALAAIMDSVRAWMIDKEIEMLVAEHQANPQR